MTTGAKIQMYRKQLGLSQEELGQKLLVSRQTISLWEKDQTLPTIDNLIKLREIFGVSVDEILGFENEKQIVEAAPEIVPNESYRFVYSKEEVNEIFRKLRRSLCKKLIIFAVICIVLIVGVISTSAPELYIGFIFGVFLVGIASHIQGIRLQSKVWKKNSERMSKSVYGYLVYNDHISLNIYRNNVKVRESKCFFEDIEKIQHFGKWLILQYGGQAFILRKSDLKENSIFYSYMFANPSKTKYLKAISWWKILSIILFVASLFSVSLGMILVDTVSGSYGIGTDKMWLFFLVTPIPIASIVLGCALKAKGYKYKKNIIVGIIMLVPLCIYGSFTFIFAETFDNSDEPIIRAEQTVGIDIPEHKEISTMDWTGGTQSVSRGYLYTSSHVFFNQADVAEFEKQIQTDEKWLSSVPNDLIGISSPLNSAATSDYTLIYNVDTAEFNTLPSSNGTYRFFNISYMADSNQMMIVEYDMEYTK